MNKLSSLTLSLVLLVWFGSCKNPEKTENKEGFSVEEETIPAQELRKIFYNMYLPDEMSRLFERVGANYDSDITNSPDNFSRYSDNNRIAVSIGIYGVDLSYSRLFEQNLAVANYLSTIKLLTDKLGIPGARVDNLYQRIENNISNQDSVAQITTMLYTKTDNYLKEQGLDSHAALVVMGGWIEALYIACKILEANSNNMEIMDRIAEQKYSLNSLLTMLNNYQDDIFVAENILMLKKLKRVFDKFDIYHSQENFSLDTVNKTITTTGYESSLTPEIATEISHVISDIRTILIL